MITITSVNQYLQELDTFEKQHIGQWFYRGHPSDSFLLQAGLFRRDITGTFSTWEDIEEVIMEVFKKEAVPYLSPSLIPTDELEWQTLAQHYGIPTRLLDWSSNPLVALYFAVESYHDTDADVWCMGFPSTNNCLPTSTYFAKRISLWQSKFVCFPKHLSPRMTNQMGCFTIHKGPTPLDQDEDLRGFLVFQQLRIPHEYKTTIINELYNLGIHKGFIYPGLEGIAARIKYELEVQNRFHTNFVDPT